MERPQILGTNVDVTERCHECRGRLVQSGEEVACTNCGVIARSERTPQIMAAATRRPTSGDNHLGSYVGTKEDGNSHAPFNGQSTVGYVKSVSDHMGEDATTWNCSALIERAAERLSLPAFVRQNAILLSARILADRKRGRFDARRQRPTVPTISAYSLLSACRSAGIHRVSAKNICQTHADLGHRVTKAKLLRLGTDASVPLGSPSIEGLLATVVGNLQSNQRVARRLQEQAVDARTYFARLMEVSRAFADRLHGQTGTSPRTVAAGSVYLASSEIGPRIVTQREVAETLGVAEYTVREFSGWARTAGPLNGGQP